MFYFLFFFVAGPADDEQIFGTNPSQMRPPHTPTSMGQGPPFPGSPVRMQDPGFR